MTLMVWCDKWLMTDGTGNGIRRMKGSRCGRSKHWVVNGIRFWYK